MRGRCFIHKTKLMGKSTFAEASADKWENGKMGKWGE